MPNNFVLVMPKYCVKQFFTYGDSPKWVKSKKWREKRRGRPNVGNNNGQLRIATPPQVAHAKPPGPIVMQKKIL